MVEGVRFEKRSVENMKDDDEFERLLGEIPHATSLNLHPPLSNAHFHRNNLVDNGYDRASCAIQTVNGCGRVQAHGVYDDSFLRFKHACASSTGSGFSLQSDGGSSSSLLCGGRSLSPPQFEELKPRLIPGNGFWLDLQKANERNLVDDLNLSGNFSQMYISDAHAGVSVDSNGFQSSANASIRMNVENFYDSDSHTKGFSDTGESNPSISRRNLNFECEIGSKLVEMQQGQRIANMLGPRYFPSRPGDRMFARSEFVDSSPSSQFYRTNILTGNNFQMGLSVPDASSTLNRHLVADALYYVSQNEMNLIEDRNPLYSQNAVQLERSMPQYGEENLLRYQPPVERNRESLHIRVPQRSVEAFTKEDSLIIQGEDIDSAMNRGHSPWRGHWAKGFHHESGAGKIQDKRSHFDGCLPAAADQESYRSPRMYCPFSLHSKCTSIAQAQGHIYHIAKDQHGCRFLQRMFDEGTSRDIQIIYNEIIDHTVELMMNPFGNYLMQKLLEVCSEEQRMQILLKVTSKPGELVRVSLNTHGTRVVQKLIETLNTRQQILLVISALEPGFLALIKDLNGNHVVQRCLQCFSNEDSKFIFVAAAKYCVDIAMHQHGCCVLQRCIRHSNGEHRENLVAEISENGLLLAQDAFGNYVVQFILELKIQSATSKLTSQFENNYVPLAMQKFSSHVVEKCLELCDDKARSKIIDELLSANPFEQLLQDPHANYVVQRALRVSEGPLHNALVDAIESHKAISRNSPYSKRIFSHKLLKR